ncbi:STAS domain-containing protein [Actinoplanes sp. GCM10030250]|uniref:STAS domain-containing protein n=1 Tax=Actinoplanes sp. GCM10030250 TaxID=3273376 RepID=UPI00361A593D
MRPLRGSRTACGSRRARTGRRAAPGRTATRVSDPDRPRPRCAAWPGTARTGDRRRLTEEVELIIPQWQHRVEYAANVCTVTLSGELDMAIGDDLADLLAVAAGHDSATTVQVDLTYVTFLDCCTIGVLIDAHHAARTQGQRLVVRGAARHIRHILDLTGALTLLAG